ncbi:S8 family serine peptidase [Ectopseudomonas mendocina]|uniref:S8 family serine peptidase n=1 Tax=Ectopseudomonas mendocina TaxID=300 RepID=A0ABZ2RPA4_ECTME
MNTELRIGFIDSGFAPHQAPRITQARRFWLEGDELRQGEPLPDALGHGCGVLDALCAQSETVSVFSAQVFAGQWQTSPLQIAAALYWLLEQNVSLINMSLGLRSDRPVLREACAELQSAGVLLCASSPAQGEPVYPASYPGVIRITGDARCNPGQWSWLNSAQADFGAHVSRGSGLAGASLACATLSGLIVGYLQEHPDADRQSVFDWLSRGAAYTGQERRR